MFGANKLVLQDAVPEVMEHALGTIQIIDEVARTVLDEPFVLKAAENYFKEQDTDFMEIMEWWIQQSNKAQAHRYAWVLMMMNALTKAFKTRAICDWPNDPSVLSQCTELAGNAEIVDQQQVITRLCSTKLRQIFDEKNAQSSLETVSAEPVKQHAADLGKYCPTDKTCINMVISYPAIVTARLVPRPDPDFKGLKQVVIKVDETNFGAIFPQSHVEFLDRTKTRLKWQAERSSKRKAL
ncbi:hypothetical protein BGZ91_006491 [Linnemannia elongata]|nr:hypothetical protein BGZ91_006491 [Linnemannia elongata]